jgi:hypothetical protein
MWLGSAYVVPRRGATAHPACRLLYTVVVMRGLAFLLAAAMGYGLSPAFCADATPSGELCIVAADLDGVPAEPSGGSACKLAKAVLDAREHLTAPRSLGVVVALEPGLSAGELHAPHVERPPISTFAP